MLNSYEEITKQFDNLKELLEKHIFTTASSKEEEIYTPTTHNNDSEYRQYTGEKVMVFLQLGWIFVGNLYSHGSKCVLKNTINCRTQNMGKGWGWIAQEGQDACKTDPYHFTPVEFHVNQLLFTVKVDENKWEVR